VILIKEVMTLVNFVIHVEPGKLSKGLERFKRESAFVLREYKENQYFLPASAKRKRKQKRKGNK